MKETIEIQALFVKGERLKHGYQLMEVDGEVHKIAYEDIEKLKKILMTLTERKEEKIKNDFDDFTYDSRVEGNSEPKEYAKVETLDEIKRIFERLKNQSDNKNNRLISHELLEKTIGTGFQLEEKMEVKNVVNLPEQFIEWFNNNEKRKEKAKLFLAKKSNKRVSENFSSFIGTYQYFTEGTEIYAFNGKQISMLENEELSKIIGVKYSYMDGTANRGIRTFRSIDDSDINEVIHHESEFRRQHNDASIINLIVEANNCIGLVNPDCLILNRNVVKKGV